MFNIVKNKNACILMNNIVELKMMLREDFALRGRTVGNDDLGVGLKKKEELKNCIDEINVKRALVSSVLFSVATPFVILMIHLFKLFDLHMWITLLISMFVELFQIANVLILYFLLKNKEVDKYKIVYIIYYGVTIAAFIAAAAMDMDNSGSEIIYIVTCVYFIFVPILNDKIRIPFIAGQTILMIFFILLLDLRLRSLFDIAIVQLGTTFLSKYQYNLTERIEKISENLRRKTLYSEQDALTGLTNRRGLKNKAELIWPYCQRRKVPVGIIALDIDFFKKYNDKFGHLEGDKCLKVIADTIKEATQRSSDIVTRTGGEEFLVFVQDITPKEILSLALNIRAKIEEQSIVHAYCGISKYVTVSMGISTTIPKFDYEFNDLYDEADRALYQAKKNGRNCIVFDGNLYGRMKDGMSQIIGME